MRGRFKFMLRDRPLSFRPVLVHDFDPRSRPNHRTIEIPARSTGTELIRLKEGSSAPAARELLDVLTCSDADRAALIGRLAQRDDARLLAELPIDIESDPNDITRMQLAEGLRRALG